MSVKHLFGCIALAAALAGAAWLCIHRQGGGGRAGAAVEDAKAAPRPLPATGVAVRAVPPSALGARPTSDRLPPAVPSSKDVAAVTDAASGSLDARLAALAGHGKSLQEVDVDALLSFLDRRDAEDALPPEKLNALKNDVANLLRAQTRFPELLPWRLAAMWRDPLHDVVWRDYCIQHAGAAWPRIANKAARDEVRDVLWSAAADPAAPGSGTSLIALRNLAESGAEERKKVAALAAATAESGSAPEGVRVTALQIAAELGAPGAASLARPILSDRSQPVHLRMSAAAALGMAGDASDLPALKALAATSDPRLRAAASSALRRLGEIPEKQ